VFWGRGHYALMRVGIILLSPSFLLLTFKWKTADTLLTGAYFMNFVNI
jgi:hypothetical protein